MDEALIIKTYNEGVNAVITLVKGMNAKVSDLIEEVLSLQQDVSSLSKSNLQLNTRISELEARMNKNSSKPPSLDGYKKPQNGRQKTGKSTGGQWGHEGKTLEKVQNPDEVHAYLGYLDGFTPFRRSQVFKPSVY